MKVEISEEGIVFCDKLVCGAYLLSSAICGDCPLLLIGKIADE